jgi:hypothetical protein
MKRYSSILTVTLLFSIVFCSKSNAQAREFGNFVSAGPQDAELLLKAYLSPWLNAFGGSLTGGWYNTAKAHKLGGFDITLSFNTAFVPSRYKTFDVDALGLQSLVRAPGTDPVSPTVAGNSDPGPQMQYDFEDFQQDAFNLPQGTGIPYMASPIVQAGVGLWKGTEIMGRFFPRIHYKRAYLGMWGVGLKHDIKQWIPGLKDVPVLNISLMGGYTRLNSGVELDVTPESVGLAEYNDTDSTTWDNQDMVLRTSSFTVNLLMSADLPIVTFYGGIGFANTKTSLKLEGNYPMISGVEGGVPNVVAVADPVDFEVKNQDGGVTKPRLNLGMRLKFGVFTMQFDYVRANYNIATFGLGISFR